MYRVNHPNVAKIYSHFHDKENIYLVMELISGADLSDRLTKNKDSRKVKLNYMKEIILAISCLHQMNPPVIHRDIKPANILIDKNNNIKITDFGVSNYIFYETRRTQTGTPLFWAPEIINGGKQGVQVDIWSLGVLFFDILIGKKPFQGKDVATINENIKNDKISWPSKTEMDKIESNDIIRDLISKILVTNPYGSLSLNEIQKHKLFTSNNNSTIPTDILKHEDKSNEHILSEKSNLWN